MSSYADDEYEASLGEKVSPYQVNVWNLLSVYFS